jgi:hypothetical protein
MSNVLRFAAICLACKDGLHSRCGERLAELFGDKHAPCLCRCYDEHGEMLESALIDMARRQPEALARHIRVTAAVDRGSLGCHLRTATRKRSAL